jgi:hypothetical protein
MAKKYTRKQVGSLHELDREQERVKRITGKMEQEWLDTILNPQQIAISLITSLLSRKKNSGSNKSRNTLLTKTKDRTGTQNKNNNGKLQQIAGSVMGYAKQPAVAGLAKRAGISFLRWQAFNLAWFLGKKGLKLIQKKRAEKKLEHKVQSLLRQHK